MNRYGSKAAGMTDDEIAALIKRLKREIPDAQALLAQLIRTQKARERRAAKSAATK